MINKNDPSGYVRNTSVLSTTHQIFENRPNAASNLPLPDPNADLQLTDIMPDTKFELPDIKAESVLDVSKAVRVEPEGAGADRDSVNEVAAQYMDANQRCMNMIRDACIEADKEHGASVFDSLIHQPQSSNAISAAVSTAPTGVAGNAYAVINQVAAQARRPNDAKVTEILGKALTELHKASDVEKSAFRTGQRPTPPEFDFTRIQNPAQLQKFIERDPMDDKVMQDVLAAHESLDIKDMNVENYKNHYTDNVTPEKIAVAVEKNDREMVEKLTKSAPVADAVLTGNLDAATALLEGGQSVAETRAAKNTQNAFNIKPEDTGILPLLAAKVQPWLNMELEPRKLGLDSVHSPTLPTMGL